MAVRLARLRRACRLRHPIVRETLAELVGTTTLVFIGNSTIANNLRSPAAAAVNVPLGYVTAVILAVLATGGVSGGHVNPAVTLALCLTGRCSMSRLLPFTIAQFAGGFLGAFLTHGLFFDLLQSDPQRMNSSLYGIFATYPNNDMSIGGAFLDQILGTAILLFGIMAITDKRNLDVPKAFSPLATGIVLYGAIACSSSNTGAALNPARDLAPRLYSYIIGYQQVFSAGGHFWWIPVVAVYLGGLLGAFVYLFGIELHHPPHLEGEGEEKERTTRGITTRETSLNCGKIGWENAAQETDGYM